MKNLSHLHWIHWLVIALSFVLTTGAWYFAHTQVTAKQERQFTRSVESVHELLKIRMQKYEDALWAGVATVESQSAGLDHMEWRRFADVLNIEERYPGINGIGVIYEINKSETEAYNKRQQVDRPEFKVYPPHDAAESFPITYIEPIQINRAALGLDMAHETNRYNAIKRARRTGLATITGPIILVQDTRKTPGFLFHAPFYENNINVPFMTESERNDNFIGTVYAPFIFDKLIQGVLDQGRRNVAIRISDENTVLYDEVGQSQTAGKKFFHSEKDNFYGRVWTIDVLALPSFYQQFNNNQPLFILVGGIIIDGLLIYLFLTMARTREQALGEARDSSEKLSTRENELEMIFNNVPARIWYKDARNKILRLNKTAAEAMGGTVPDFEGKNTYDLFPEVAEQYHNDDMDVMNSNKPKLGIIEEFKPVGGAHGWIRTDKVPYIDPRTGEKMILVVSQDITPIMQADIEREELITKLAASNEELERFAYIASHDLQEPLRMVKSYTQLLQQKYEKDLDDDGRKYIYFATDAATRMQSLIEDLLDYAKLGDNSEKYEDIDCNETVAYVLDNLAGVINDKKATVKVDDLPTIHANEIRISRLFQNLIGNAIKYSKPGTSPLVRVRVEDKGEFYEFAVKDNGIGIRIEYLDQIFEPFKRLHGKNEYPGTGIGLAICYKIVDGLGGRIWANSEIDKGSTFYFTIPKQ